MALLLFFIARLNFFIESSEWSRCLFFFLQEYHEKSFVEVRIETRDYASLVCLEMAYFFYHTWARNVTHIEYWCFSCITSIQKNLISISYSLFALPRGAPPPKVASVSVMKLFGWTVRKRLWISFTQLELGFWFVSRSNLNPYSSYHIFVGKCDLAAVLEWNSWFVE